MYCIMLQYIKWYCKVIYGITRYCMLSYGIALGCIVLHSILYDIFGEARYCMVLYWYYMVFHGNTLFDLYCMILHRTVLCCMVLYGIAFFCISKCISKRSNAMQCNAMQYYPTAHIITRDLIQYHAI